GPAGLEAALHRLTDAASHAVDAEPALLVLSDRGVDAAHAAIPMLLAVGAVHHHLIREGKRMRASILAETGSAWDVHHFALLLGYGAGAINPYLAYQVVRELVEAEEAGSLDLRHA